MVYKSSQTIKSLTKAKQKRQGSIKILGTQVFTRDGRQPEAQEFFCLRLIIYAEGGNRLRYVSENGRCRAFKPAQQCPEGLLI